MFSIEETLWGVSFLVITQCKNIFKKFSKDKRATTIKAFVIFLEVFCIGYGLCQWCYVLSFNIWSKVADNFAHGTHFSGLEAFRQVLFDFIATRVWDRFGDFSFFIWRSGYFSLCSWMCIVFCKVPRIRNNSVKEA